MSNQRGRFDRTSGKFTLDRAAKSGSVELNIETASVSTGDNVKGSRPRTLDEHLKTADFFNVAEFPRMTFKSTGVKFAGDNPAEIAGNLTLLGRHQAGHAQGRALGVQGQPDEQEADVRRQRPSATIKRTDFGMKYGVPAIGDEVRLWISVEGYKD